LQNNTFSGLIVGQKIVVLKRIDSTNDYLKRELAKSTPFPEGTVIMAEEQYSGRGQVENKWLSPPGLNLTFSVLLMPQTISPENQFDLNIAVSLSVNDVLRHIVGREVKIKWPNDIYYREKKIGGILIENALFGRTWKSAIVGIGLNVNQTEFDPSLKHVSSLRAIINAPLDKSVVLTQLCKALDKRYKDIDLEKDSQRAEYAANLLGINEVRRFIIAGQEVWGIIKGVDDFGRLVLKVENELMTLSFKELSFVIEQ
jgi:BirA family transcriptional regulator, biotin operon repressor / biotin---[acetyl-CoA-carboxylase] ligase